MDTLGSLCDKLIIVKLKQWHTMDTPISDNLQLQAEDLQTEINDFVNAAWAGMIPLGKLQFNAYKICRDPGLTPIEDSIGALFSQLASVNCELWHEVDKSYHVDDLPHEDKTLLVKRLAQLNLDRNRYKEAIDALFHKSLCS